MKLEPAGLWTHVTIPINRWCTRKAGWNFLALTRIETSVCTYFLAHFMCPVLSVSNFMNFCLLSHTIMYFSYLIFVTTPVTIVLVICQTLQRWNLETSSCFLDQVSHCYLNFIYHAWFCLFFFFLFVHSLSVANIKMWASYRFWRHIFLPTARKMHLIVWPAITASSMCSKFIWIRSMCRSS